MTHLVQVHPYLTLIFALLVGFVIGFVVGVSTNESGAPRR